MKIEKFEDWLREESEPESEYAWNHQQTKIDNILEYIRLIGHQKELDRFLNNSKDSI